VRQQEAPFYKMNPAQRRCIKPAAKETFCRLQSNSGYGREAKARHRDCYEPQKVPLHKHALCGTPQVLMKVLSALAQSSLSPTTWLK
jgi:hypothetical protein